MLGTLLIGMYSVSQIKSQCFFAPTHDILGDLTDLLPYENRMIQETRDDSPLTYESSISLHARWYPAPKPDLILFIHGNGGNLTYRQNQYQIFHELGYQVLAFDYRGYGQSTGQPSEIHMYQDACMIWDHLIDLGYTSNQLIVYGESIGCAVASQLATKRPVERLILQSGFNCMANVAHHLVGGPRLLWKVLCPEFPTEHFLNEAIHKYHPKILILHSHEDELIPYKLRPRLPKEASIREYQLKGGHNLPDLGEDYQRTLIHFLQADSHLQAEFQSLH